MTRRSFADGPLGLLALVATLFVAALASFVASQTLPYDPFVACETLLTTFVARLTSLGLLLPLALLAMIVLAGALALSHQLWATRNMLTELRERKIVDLPDALSETSISLGLANRIDLIRDDAAFVFCHGYVRPGIIISSGMLRLLDPSELRAVLLHERHHVLHRDPLKILIGRSLASALFFLPLAGALRNSYLAGKEICADLDALTSEGSEALASAVLKALSAEGPAWPAGVLAVGSLSPMQTRLERLVSPDRPRARWASITDWMVSAALAAAIFGFGYGSVVASQSEPIGNACRTVSPLADYAVDDSSRGARGAGGERNPAPAALRLESPSLGVTDSSPLSSLCLPECALLECHQVASPR